MNAKRPSEPNQKSPVADPSAGRTHREAEDRDINQEHEHEVRDKMMDKTLADSYPASDPPSSIPDPSEEDSLDKEKEKDEAA
jgi:hypothetical protein